MAIVKELAIGGAWLLEPTTYRDNRGQFREWYKKSTSNFGVFANNFHVNQANISISKKATVRGLHYSLANAGQAKIITCLAGSAFDVIADIRVGSPTFGSWVSVHLTAENGNTIYLSSGLAHGVMTLENGTAISYLLSSEFSLTDEYGVNPLDETFDIKWPIKPRHISEKDLGADSLDGMLERNLLPIFHE